MHLRQSKGIQSSKQYMWKGCHLSIEDIRKGNLFRKKKMVYLTIIPRARMGSESIAHEAEVRMGYSLRGHEGERNNCFSKIQLVGQKYRE